MRNEKITETVKNVIEEDLFVDVDKRSCVIDYFLQNPKEFEKNKNTLNRVSVTFFNTCKKQLENEFEKGNILFFRKYGYEKILNDYLCKNYHVEKMELDLFPPENTSVESSQKSGEEIARKEINKKEKEREEKEREVLANLDSVVWFKRVKKKFIRYKGIFRDGKKLEVRIKKTAGENEQGLKGYLKYDGERIYHVDYDINTIINTIQKPSTGTGNDKTNNKAFISDTDVELKKNENAS